MNAERGYSQYQKTSVQTADEGDLLLKLYRGAIRFLFQAEKGMLDEDYETANNMLIRAQDIVNELRFSLDLEYGGEVADQLFALYDYMYRRLVEANAAKEAEPIQEVRSMISELLSTWQQAVEEVDAGELAAARREVQAKREAAARDAAAKASSEDDSAEEGQEEEIASDPDGNGSNGEVALEKTDSDDRNEVELGQKEQYTGAKEDASSPAEDHKKGENGKLQDEDDLSPSPPGELKQAAISKFAQQKRAKNFLSGGRKPKEYGSSDGSEKEPKDKKKGEKGKKPGDGETQNRSSIDFTIG